MEEIKGLDPQGNDIIHPLNGYGIQQVVQGSGIAIQHPFSREIYLDELPVVGMRYRDHIGSLVAKLQVGDTLYPVREPTNFYDSRAILVCDGDGEKLGYIPRARNEIYANLMDAGKELTARIRAKYQGTDLDRDRQWMQIEIYLVD